MYRYTLEKYGGMSTRHTCPQCEKPKKYTRYIDVETNEHLPYEYGKCERVNNCDYHLNPYNAGYHLTKMKDTDWNPPRLQVKKRPPKKQAPVFIPYSYFKKSLTNYSNNNFVDFLFTLFDEEKTQKLIERFYIGTSKYWDGATVFWLIDEDDQIRGGQVILYNEFGKTKKELQKDGSTKRYNSWVHTAIKSSYGRSGKSIPEWLKKYSKSENPKSPCLFGLPQLKTEPRNKPIAIVESAKTAIIATGFYPEYIWLAVGGLEMLNEKRLKALEGRNVTLFPDKGGFEKWKKKITQRNYRSKFNLSDLLEKLDVECGKDIADFLEKNGT